MKVDTGDIKGKIWDLHVPGRTLAIEERETRSKVYINLCSTFILMY